MQSNTPPMITPYDHEVPIVREGTNIHMYIMNHIKEPFFYVEMCHRLQHATPYETCHIHLNTPGGVVDSAFMIIDAIRNCKGTTVCHLTGSVASAGTIIALSCQELVVAPFTSWMTHNYSGQVGGKGHEIKARQEFIDKNLTASFKELHQGFYTKSEIQDIINGKDFWLDHDEIKARWADKQFSTDTSRPKKADDSKKPKKKS
jgi:ATP-dependent protease ClpP protease subunit